MNRQFIPDGDHVFDLLEVRISHIGSRHLAVFEAAVIETSADQEELRPGERVNIFFDLDRDTDRDRVRQLWIASACIEIAYILRLDSGKKALRGRVRVSRKAGLLSFNSAE